MRSQVVAVKGRRWWWKGVGGTTLKVSCFTGGLKKKKREPAQTVILCERGKTLEQDFRPH